MAARPRQRGMDLVGVGRACSGEFLQKCWEQRGSQAASLLMLPITRAGLSASSKREFNHGKHQREITHRSSVTGCKRVEALGQCCTRCLVTEGKGEPFAFGGKAAGPRCNPGDTSALDRVLRAAGFSCGPRDTVDLEELHTQT